MNIEIKQFNLDMIENSSEISGWLTQFSDIERNVAISLLLNLKFISRDSYAAWFNNAIKLLPQNEKSAFYAVRKLREDINCLWDQNGNTSQRPPETLGSEDLVYSLIANIKRNNKNYFDHSSLTELRNEQIHNIVLIEDSIGSGKRVSDFIKKMINNSTLKSWWSYGKIKFYILSFARIKEAEKKIIESTPGTDHWKRKFKRSEKFDFKSKIVYSQNFSEKRWGKEFQNIVDLCVSKKKISKMFRLGYGEVMGNIVFFHSVPNNIPGILHSSDKNWTPLFPERNFPSWLTQLLDNSVHSKKIAITEELKQILLLIKRGVRKKSSLALGMDCDVKLIDELLNKILKAGFITEKRFLTKAGLRFLHENKIVDNMNFNYSLYIPSSWRIDQSSTQPFALKNNVYSKQTDSEAICEKDMETDGEIGKIFLERTDAMTAKPSLTVKTHEASKSRKSLDSHGPEGLKEE